MHKKNFSCQYPTAETGFKENLMKDVDPLIKLQVRRCNIFFIDRSEPWRFKGGRRFSQQKGWLYILHKLNFYVTIMKFNSKLNRNLNYQS